MKVVYLLYFNDALFGVYGSINEADQAQKRYESSGKCGGHIGYFKPIRAVEINKDLMSAYLPDGIKRPVPNTGDGE